MCVCGWLVVCALVRVFVCVCAYLLFRACLIVLVCVFDCDVVCLFV